MDKKVGVISFDLDGVLANFIRGFTRIAHRLFGSPVGDGQSHATWMFEDFPELQLTKEQCDWLNGPVWNEIRQSPDFWYNLDPFNPSVMHRINGIQNKVFITDRLGIEPLRQSIAFLERWGVTNPRVIIASQKGPVFEEENVVAHVDDRYKNCLDLRSFVPTAYNALFYAPYNKIHHDEWKQLGGEIVLSVDHFIDECDRRGLIRY